MFIPMAMHSSDFKLRLVASVPYFHCKLIFTVIIAVATDIYKFSNLGLLSRALGFRDFSNKAKPWHFDSQTEDRSSIPHLKLYFC